MGPVGLLASGESCFRLCLVRNLRFMVPHVGRSEHGPWNEQARLGTSAGRCQLLYSFSLG